MQHRFSIMLTFTLLAGIGWALVPRLPFRLQPSRVLPSLKVSYQWAQAGPELIEQQATSVIEGALATLSDLREIRSTTYPGRGRITLEFDPERDMDLARYEVSARLRQLRSRLPEGMSFPLVEAQFPEEGADRPLLTYTLSGPAPPDELYRYAEERLKPALARLSGLARVDLYGDQPYAWELRYDPAQLQALGLNPAELGRLAQQPFFQSSLAPGVQLRATAPGPDGELHRHDLLNWPLRLPTSDSSLLLRRLGDLATLQRQPQSPPAYQRINGLSAVNLLLYSDPQTSQLTLAKEVRAEVEHLAHAFPPGYALRVSYDATTFLREELVKIGSRSALALGLLLLFVLLVSRSWRYLGQIFLSLLATLGLAALGAYFLKLELHLYSLAGLTLSFGLVIDNSLVMSEHLRLHGNRRAFLALLAATLTTLGALSVVYALDEATRLRLVDFALVMGLSLSASLAVAWWLLPAMVAEGGYKGYKGYKGKKEERGTSQKGTKGPALYPIPLYRIPEKPRSSARALVRALRGYGRFLHLARRGRWLLVVLGVLGFGLPVFLLPEEVEEDGWEWYNVSLGSTTYQREVKPWTDLILGGSLRLFLEETYPQARYQDPERTALYVRAQLPYGTSIEQMNETIRVIENFLVQFDEIDQFQTTINSSQDARLVILFRDSAERAGFPYRLKSRLISQANSLTGADWSVYGVGRGFSNAIGMGGKNSRIVLKGYNYQQLRRYGERLKAELLQHPRIQEVYLNGKLRYDYRPHDELVLSVDARALATLGSHPQALWEQMRQRNLAPQSLRYAFIDGRYEPLMLRPQSDEAGKRWQVMEGRVESLELKVQSSKLGGGQSHLSPSKSQIRIGEVASLVKEPVNDLIERHNQEYQLLVEYDFIGPTGLQRKVQQRMIEQTNGWLPLGYRAEWMRYRGGWNKEDPKQYGLLIPVLLIILGICAILLESMRQPLAVLSLIPVSFIGVFLTFYLFSVNFDQGGYASFLLLSGISVNAGLYLINDYNAYRNRYPRRSPMACYLKAVRSKLMPILLTILSTLLGMLPFVIGEAEPFWFALAMGSMGGLVFSLLGVLVYLPLAVVGGDS